MENDQNETQLLFFGSMVEKKFQPATLEQIVEVIRRNSYVRAVTERYRESGDKNLKKTLPAFLPGCIVEGFRRKNCVTRVTGYSLFDVDHLTAEEVEKYRKIASTDAHVVIGYVTVSGSGYRIIFSFDVDRTRPLEEQMHYYALAYEAGNRYFAELGGHEYDAQCKDIVHLSCCAYDPDVIFNPAATPFTEKEILGAEKKSTRRGRRTVNKIDNIFSKIIEPQLRKAEVKFEPHSHNNYIMRVAYIFNRLGVALDDVVAWGRERYAAEFPEYAETMKRCYTAAAAEFAADKSTLDNLRGNRLKNDSLPIATVVDVENFLSTQIVARYNQTSGRLEYKSVGEGDDKFVNLEDIMVNTLWCRMSRFFRVNDRYITHVLASEYSRPYNPIMEYLNSLPEWDESQPDYLDILAKTVTVEGGAAKQAQFSKHLRKWLVGMVAGWINPKVVNHVILVLLGRQGAFKSAWFANLLPPELRDYYVIKTNSSYLDKDDHLCFSNKLMVLFDEVDTMDARNTNQLKAAVTATHSDIRAPYAHFSEHRKHIASLCGTGNKRCFLNDDTGTRRWLVYWVKSIVSPFFNENNYTGIYSQAYALYKNGFQYWFDAGEIAEQEEHNKQFSVAHMERELIQTYFRKPYPNEIGEIYSASAILSYISGSIGYKLTVERVNSAMEQLGFERRRTATTRGWLCIKRTPDEIAEFRKRLAMDSEPDDQ